jgi:hypothetical protein
MKLTTTVSALILSALASSNGADALSRHGNSRRSLQLNDNGAGSSSNLLKRVPLAQPEVQHVAPAGMQKMVKRQPLPAGFGSIPSMNDGNMPIVGGECSPSCPTLPASIDPHHHIRSCRTGHLFSRASVAIGLDIHTDTCHFL